MFTSTSRAGAPAGTVLSMQKIGLALAVLLAAADLYLPFMPHPGGDGPPASVAWTAFGLGLVTLLGIGWAIRSPARPALWLVAGTRIVSGLLAVPAFFVDAPAGIKVVAAVIVALTAAVVVLLVPAVPRRGHNQEVLQ